MSNKEFIKEIEKRLLQDRGIYDWILNNRYNITHEQMTRLLLEFYCIYDKDMTTSEKQKEICFQLHEYLGEEEE